MERTVDQVLASYEQCYLTSKCNKKCAYYPLYQFKSPNIFNPLPCNQKMLEDIKKYIDEGKLRFSKENPDDIEMLEWAYCKLEKVDENAG